MDGLKPNDETICNFRRDNAKALRQTFHEFSEMWREQGLYGGKIVVTDVTKIRTKYLQKNNHNRITVKQEFYSIEKRNLKTYTICLKKKMKF